MKERRHIPVAHTGNLTAEKKKKKVNHTVVSDSVVDVDVEVVEDLTLVSDVEDTDVLSIVEVVVTEACTRVSVSVSVWISVAVVIASA